MKPIAFFVTALLLSAFGITTVFMSGSVIFDLFNIRSHEGNYVPFVVWANMISGLLFLAAAFGFITKQRWTVIPLGISIIILVMTFLGLVIHIYAGGLYENKTVGAMIFRVIVNVALFSAVRFTSNSPGTRNVMQKGLLFSLPILILLSSCGQRSDKTDTGDHAHAKDHEHHDENASAIVLDDGKKWAADDNTLRLVLKMEDEVTAYGETPQSDYKTLADSLQKDLDLLVKGCTMTGKAHDELHKWLVPNIDYVKSLKNAQNQDEAKEALKKLDASYDVFNQSFE